MATRLFIASFRGNTHRGMQTPKLDGTDSGWSPWNLRHIRPTGLSSTSASVPTVTGPTNGVEIFSTTDGPSEWLSLPVAEEVTISGTITANLWASENNLSANVAINVVIDIVRGPGATSIVEIARSTNTVELATSSAAYNFTTGMTSGAYTSQTVNVGDRLRVRVFGDDAGTMATGFSFQLAYSEPTPGSFGDTWIEFTEDILFAEPAGHTVVYLTDVASDVSTGSVCREAWKSRGSGVQTDVTNTQAGWVSPFQVTDTAGGTVVDWFTKQLQGFTLSGMAVMTVWPLSSSALANASLRCEIARVDADGTNPTVWGDWCMATGGNNLYGEISASQLSNNVLISGEDLEITTGQRLRIRLYICNTGALPMASGHTITISYAASTAAATGDTFVQFPQTLLEPGEQVDPYANKRVQGMGGSW